MTSSLVKSLRRAVAGLALVLCAASAVAASSASSAASDSLASSVGSVSDSFRGSSNASSPGGRTAAGDFRIVEVVAVADRPERALLVLEPVAGQGSGQEAPGFTLELPSVTVARESLSAGDVIAARPRPYGVEFAVAERGTRRVFFLVLEDAWYRELPARPVRL